MDETQIFERMQELRNAMERMSRERDELIRELRGRKSSRQVAEFCGRSHAYVCKIWKEQTDV